MNPRPSVGRPAAFTLVETLVVISLIMILISLLLPLFSASREAGRRAMCASRQRELNLAAVTFSGDNGSQLPITDRQSLSMTQFTNTSSTDHVHWVNEVFFTFFREERGMELFKFTCPNRGEEFVKAESSNPVRYRTGYYLLWGRMISKWSTSNVVPWDSPTYSHDDPELMTTADINEEGTVNPGSTSGSHGRTGNTGLGDPSKTPGELGALGGNIGRLDGSVQWVEMKDMFRRNASSSGGVKGWW